MFLTVTCLSCARRAPEVGVLGGRFCAACRTLLSRPAEVAPDAAGAPALVAYDDVGRVPVLALKYRSARAVVPLLADGLAARARQQGWTVGLDAVTWAPTGAVRRRRRGYDQGELLARATARRLGVPSRRLLVRVGDDSGQTGRSRQQRLVGPSFVASGRVPHRVLVVDDVVTTGATLAAARTALLVGGAHRVHVLAVAATPFDRAESSGRPVSQRPAVP